MARTYLSDTVESTWEVPEHETFANLADRIEDYMNQPQPELGQVGTKTINGQTWLVIDSEYDVEHDVALCQNYDTCYCYCERCIVAHS